MGAAAANPLLREHGGALDTLQMYQAWLCFPEPEVRADPEIGLRAAPERRHEPLPLPYRSGCEGSRITQGVVVRLTRLQRFPLGEGSLSEPEGRGMCAESTYRLCVKDRRVSLQRVIDVKYDG